MKPVEAFIRFKVKCDKHLPPSSDVAQIGEVIFVLLKHPLVPERELHKLLMINDIMINFISANVLFLTRRSSLCLFHC